MFLSFSSKPLGLDRVFYTFCTFDTTGTTGTTACVSEAQDPSPGFFWIGHIDQNSKMSKKCQKVLKCHRET